MKHVLTSSIHGPIVNPFVDLLATGLHGLIEIYRCLYESHTRIDHEVATIRVFQELIRVNCNFLDINRTKRLMK